MITCYQRDHEKYRSIFNFSHGLTPFCSPAQTHIWAPKVWFQRHFLSQLCSLELTGILSFPSTDLFLLKTIVMFKRERAAVGEAFRGEDLYINICFSGEDWGYWFVKQLDLHQKESLPTSKCLAAAAPGGYGDDQAWIWRTLPMQNHFPDGVDSCMEKTFSWNWFCGTPQVFWTTHLSEIFALLKEIVGIASAQEKSIITLFLIWEVHLLCTKQTQLAIVTWWKLFSP